MTTSVGQDPLTTSEVGINTAEKTMGRLAKRAAAISGGSQEKTIVKR